MIEPIMGEGGIKVVPDWCLKELRKLCNKKKILLILDEVNVEFQDQVIFLLLKNLNVLQI